MLIKVFCVVSMLNKLPQGCVGGGGGLLNKGGGSNRLPALVTKQQAVEFPQVLTSLLILYLHVYSSTCYCVCDDHALILYIGCIIYFFHMSLKSCVISQCISYCNRAWLFVRYPYIDDLLALSACSNIPHYLYICALLLPP